MKAHSISCHLRLTKVIISLGLAECLFFSFSGVNVIYILFSQIHSIGDKEFLILTLPYFKNVESCLALFNVAQAGCGASGEVSYH